MQTLEIRENDRILVVAPHPDDECIGAGGLLCTYPGQCSVLVLSDGREGQGDCAPETVKEIRKAEFTEEMEYLGIRDYRMLGIEDGTLARHTDCMETMELSGYTKIFVTGMHDNHPDHTAAFASVCRAMRKQVRTDAQLYLYEIHAPLQDATHMLDITDVMDKKLELVRFHRSQLKGMPYDRYAKSMAEYRGLQNRLPGRCLEVYTRVPPDREADAGRIGLEEKLQKHILFYQVLTRWLELKVEGHGTGELLAGRGYRRIAVYGYAELGKLLCLELCGSGMGDLDREEADFGTADVMVSYVMDKKVKDTGRENLPVYVPGSGLPAVDAVVVTAVYDFDGIWKELSEMGFCHVLSLRTLLGWKIQEEGGRDKKEGMKKIIVFGTGNYFGSKKKELWERYEVTAFLDNKVGLGEDVTYGDTGIKVMNPAMLAQGDSTEIFLMSVHFVSMWKQLCGMGVAPERLVFPYTLQPYFENEDALCHCLEKIVFSADFFSCFRKDGSVVRIEEERQWRSFLREAYKERYPIIHAVADMPPEPVSRQFGTERGTPVDRYYIGRFLEEHSGCIRGDVLEIEDSTYTERFGGERVRHALVMDVANTGPGVTFLGNLETGEGIRDGIADCLILTQTLMYIFDVKSAAHHIGRLLKKDGKALITCSGISQNSIRCMDNYGCYFNFNEDALERMFEDEAGLRVTEKGSYGNVKTVSAHLNGLCMEDLEEEDFVVNDRYYPLIVYAVVEKL